MHGPLSVKLPVSVKICTVWCYLIVCGLVHAQLFIAY